MIVTTYFGKKQGLKFSAGSGGGSESRYFRPKKKKKKKKKKKIVAKGLRMVQFGEKIKKKILTQN